MTEEVDMLDFITAIIGVSFTVLAIAVTVAGASILVCAATLIKNLPRGIRALKDATESSVYALAFCGQSVAEEVWFSRLQRIFGKYVLFGFCGIYVSVVKFLAGSDERVVIIRTNAVHIVPEKTERAHGLCTHSPFGAASPSFSKLSVVMKQ